MKDLQALNSQNSFVVFMDELIMLHKGQALDIYWRDNAICPTEKEYISMVQDKTGGLFRLASSLIASLSQNKHIEVTNLVNELATLFQILDDLLNLQSESYHANKSYCEDLTEGKFSFPIVHSIQSRPNDKRLLNIVKQKTSDNILKTYALELMKETNSFEYCKQVLLQYKQKVLDSINKIGYNEALVSIVEALLAQAKF